jgi:hypothetical protein
LDQTTMHGHNKAFESDPFGYVERIAINHLAMKVYGEKTARDFSDSNRYDELGRIIPGGYSAYNNQVNTAKKAVEAAKAGEFDLEPVSLQGAHAVFLRFVVPGVYAPSVEYGGLGRGADPSIKAYWLGYLMPGLQGAGKDRIPYVDLPKAGPARKLMLTGAMNGCSMVVTQHPDDPTLLRVYHDSAHGRDTFKDDVVYARIDYTDEGYASSNAPVAAALSATAGAAAAAAAPGAPARVGAPPPVRAPAAPGCVRYSYGDMEGFAAASSGAPAQGNLSVKVRTSFNFLYFDEATGHWVAVSQPLETLPAVARPVIGWFESRADFDKREQAHQTGGTAVALAPSSPPWKAQIPY